MSVYTIHQALVFLYEQSYEGDILVPTFLMMMQRFKIQGHMASKGQRHHLNSTMWILH